MKVVIILFTTLLLANVLINCNSQNQKSNANTVYQCPMKCEREKIYYKSATCPICKMHLEKVDGNKSITNNDSTVNKITIIGSMKNVMKKGELSGNIDLDTINNKQHLFGLGPVEYLTGEIIIIDGKCYKSVVIDDSTMNVAETFSIKAPFFGYAKIDRWTETEFPDSISTIQQIENYLGVLTKKYPRPFFFKMLATADSATVHIVNLPGGTKVSSPAEAHNGQRSFIIQNQAVELLGFFSTQHKSIFTHHDTNVHIHLITSNKQKMGHLDSIHIKRGSAKLYLPKQ